jgi:hypothetical protein
MPDKPTWCGNLHEAIIELQALPYPWVDRTVIERVLGVRRRRAQQILQPCVQQPVGASGIAHRDEVIAHLRRLAVGEVASYERRRRQRLAETLQDLHRAWTQEPKAIVEAPTAIVNQDLADLPPGVTLERGKITVEFTTAVEALEKLLAIAMAAGNDLDRFTRLVDDDTEGSIYR